MKTTVSSKSNKFLDPIRKRWVAATPEERVRQSLLRQMLGPLGFPKGLLVVEGKLAHRRRGDILVYRSHGDTLSPLLLVECKAETVDTQSYLQVVGYNASFAAPFFCLAHAGGIQTFWHEGDRVQSVQFLPPYQQLLSRLSCN